MQVSSSIIAEQSSRTTHLQPIHRTLRSRTRQPTQLLIQPQTRRRTQQTKIQLLILVPQTTPKCQCPPGQTTLLGLSQIEIIRKYYSIELPIYNTPETNTLSQNNKNNTENENKLTIK